MCRRPANILLDGELHAYLSDTGFAKAAQRSGDRSGATSSVWGGAGSLGYCENALLPPDVHTDGFAVGVTLLAVLTGHDPASSTTIEELCCEACEEIDEYIRDQQDRADLAWWHAHGRHRYDELRAAEHAKKERAEDAGQEEDSDGVVEETAELVKRERAERHDAERAAAAEAGVDYESPDEEEEELLAQNMQAAGKKGKKKRSAEAEVVLAAGGQPIQIFAFWLVVVAAMAAWESKLATPSTSAMAQAKIAELAEVRDALEGRDSLVEAGALGELLPLLQLADVRSGVSGPAYRPPDSLAQLVAETLPKGEEDSLKVVRRLGCLSCQLQRHAFQAYNPLVQKATALYDVLQYGAPQPFVAPRTAPADAVPPEPNPTSNLIRLAYDADSLELPPQIFW